MGERDDHAFKTQLSFSTTSVFSGIQTAALSASPPTRITIQVAAQLTLLVGRCRRAWRPLVWSLAAFERKRTFAPRKDLESVRKEERVKVCEGGCLG